MNGAISRWFPFLHKAEHWQNLFKRKSRLINPGDTVAYKRSVEGPQEGMKYWEEFAKACVVSITKGTYKIRGTEGNILFVKTLDLHDLAVWVDALYYSYLNWVVLVELRNAQTLYGLGLEDPSVKLISRDTNPSDVHWRINRSLPGKVVVLLESPARDHDVNSFWLNACG